MLVDVATVLPCAPSEVIKHVKMPRLLLHVAHPLVKFIPRYPAQLPEHWAEGTYWLSLYVFGFIPFGKQAVVIGYPNPSTGFSIRDNGHSRLIKKWDHVITVEPSTNGTLYRDHINVEAGLLTPFIWLFAQIFYRHRHRRWHQLVARGFGYAKP
jgi:hypothetical protein